tara:strand:+ start:260 stop:451 length:192 start_codon:yes stop_codon:yes gene_type:complete
MEVKEKMIVIKQDKVLIIETQDLHRNQRKKNQKVGKRKSQSLTIDQKEDKEDNPRKFKNQSRS